MSKEEMPTIVIKMDKKCKRYRGTIAKKVKK